MCVCECLGVRVSSFDLSNGVQWLMSDYCTAFVGSDLIVQCVMLITCELLLYRLA